MLVKASYEYDFRGDFKGGRVQIFQVFASTLEKAKNFGEKFVDLNPIRGLSPLLR